ncbi:MAG: sigma-70 family RNA polymerase sigma factor [Lachnospiraceae bacterium]|nr:sigma-70 family RNA polymerase sigma factor [Lachnospiraceae bacterium]
MESLADIYRKHSQTVYGFLLARTRNPDLAEELTQETFFQAVCGIEKFRGDSSMGTWLCGIAKNLWCSYVREHKKLKGLGDEEIWSLGASLETEVLLKWDCVETLKLLHNLKEPMREVLYLRLIGNLSFAQIGEIMGKSENWARVNFYRGKEKILKEAKKHE